MIDRSKDTGVTVLAMGREPANVLDVEFADAIETAVRTEVDADDTRAIVITGSEGVFSAGVDLFRLLDGGEEYLEAFLDSLNRLFATVARSPRPVVAAINGHAIAGGGILALACDYRIMSDGGARIGLPELKVGVPFPSSALRIIRATVPLNHQREVILLGRNYGPADAMDRGLVDELADETAVLERAVEVASELGAVPPRSYELTKRLLAATEDEVAALDAQVADTWGHPATHDHIRAFLEKTLGKAAR